MGVCPRHCESVDYSAFVDLVRQAEARASAVLPMGLATWERSFEGILVHLYDAFLLQRRLCALHPLSHNQLTSNRPEISRILLSQFIGLRLRHALDEVVVVTPQLLLIVPLKVEMHEREDA